MTNGLKLLAPLFRTSLIISLFIGAVSGVVLASSSYLSQYNAAYGTAAACSLCHTSPPTLNATGNTFLNSGYNLASIAPSGKSTASSPAASLAPTAPSSPAQTTSSNPNPSPGTTNSGPTSIGNSGATQTSPGTVQNNPAKGSTSEITSPLNITEKDGTGSGVGKSNLETSKRDKGDSGQSREFTQSSGAKRPGDSNINKSSFSSPRGEGNRFPKPNIQFRPPNRIRK